MASAEIKFEIERRLAEGRKKLVEEVAAQLEKEKEAALIEARQKEVYLSCKFTFFPLIENPPTKIKFM